MSFDSVMAASASGCNKVIGAFDEHCWEHFYKEFSFFLLRGLTWHHGDIEQDQFNCQLLAAESD
jgi:hypothetical protein